MKRTDGEITSWHFSIYEKSGNMGLSAYHHTEMDDKERGVFEHDLEIDCNAFRPRDHKSPYMINPFTVGYEGKTVFTLTDPHWIAVVTAILLREPKSKHESLIEVNTDQPGD